MLTPMCLQWKDVNYEVECSPKKNWWPFKGKQKTSRAILSEVNGELNSGELVAILGASGAGKTTLLAAISQRVRGNKIRGKFTLNGREITSSEMKMMSCFVPQYSIALNMLTVREHLIFTSRLKLPYQTTKHDRHARIEAILFQLGLILVAENKIKTLSGGEKRKLSLATEFIGQPSFIFCDELTTGLDSFNAISVMRTLTKLTKLDDLPESQMNTLEFSEMEIMPRGHDFNRSMEDEKIWDEFAKSKAIICSIHQPTSDIFHCFSHIILMHEGKIVFHGLKTEAEDFFKNLGYICPEHFNPAEFYIKIISSVPAESGSSSERIDKIIEKYEQNRVVHKHIFFQGIDRILLRRQKIEHTKNWALQIYYLLTRSIIVAKRTLSEEIIKSGIYMSTSFVIALLYMYVTGTSQTSIQDVQGALFTISTEVIFTNLYAVIYTFPEELPIIRRETGEKLYNLSAYYVTCVLALIPKAIIESYVFLGVIYFLVSFAEGLWTFIAMGITLTLTAISAMSYGFMLSGLCRSTSMATEVTVPLDFLMLIFGGIYINLNSIPFFKYLSLLFFSNEALAIQYWKNIETIDCPQSNNHSCLRNGTEVLVKYAYGTDWNTIWFDYAGLLFWIIFMHLLGFLGLSSYVKKEGFY